MKEGGRTVGRRRRRERGEGRGGGGGKGGGGGERGEESETVNLIKHRRKGATVERLFVKSPLFFLVGVKTRNWML